jgi:hypothetical protein
LGFLSGWLFWELVPRDGGGGLLALGPGGVEGSWTDRGWVRELEFGEDFLVCGGWGGWGVGGLKWGRDKWR